MARKKKFDPYNQLAGLDKSFYGHIDHPELGSSSKAGHASDLVKRLDYMTMPTYTEIEYEEDSNPYGTSSGSKKKTRVLRTDLLEQMAKSKESEMPISGGSPTTSFTTAQSGNSLLDRLRNAFNSAKTQQPPQPMETYKESLKNPDDNFNPEFRKNHPIISKGIDIFTKVARNTIMKPMEISWIDRAVSNAANAMTMSNATKLEDTGSKIGNITADIIGTGLGYAQKIPGAGFTAIEPVEKAMQPINRVIDKGAAKLSQQAFKKAPNYAAYKAADIASKYGSKALKSSLEWGTQAGVEGVIRDMDKEDIAKSVLENMAMGAAFGAGTKALNEAVLPNIVKTTVQEKKLGLKKADKNYKIKQQIQNEILNQKNEPNFSLKSTINSKTGKFKAKLPESERIRLANKKWLDEYLNYIGYLDEVTNYNNPKFLMAENKFRAERGLPPIGNVGAKVTIKKERIPLASSEPKPIKKPVFNSKDKQIALMTKHVNIDDLIDDVKNQIREKEEAEFQRLKEYKPQGVEQGGVIKDSQGNVIGRYGRTSNNSEWWQEAYKLFGRKPKNDELREIARKHLRDGFVDMGIEVPPDEHYLDLLKQLEDYENYKLKLQGQQPKIEEFKAKNDIKKLAKHEYKNTIVRQEQYVNGVPQLVKTEPIILPTTRKEVKATNNITPPINEPVKANKVNLKRFGEVEIIRDNGNTYTLRNKLGTEFQLGKDAFKKYKISEEPTLKEEVKKEIALQNTVNEIPETVEKSTPKVDEKVEPWNSDKPFNENLVKRANSNFSFSRDIDYNKQFKDHIKEVENEINKLFEDRADNGNFAKVREELNAALEQYKKKYYEWQNKVLQNKAKMPSPVVAGPAKYPWHKWEKVGEIDRKLHVEEWPKVKAIIENAINKAKKELGATFTEIKNAQLEQEAKNKLIEKINNSKPGDYISSPLINRLGKIAKVNDKTVRLSDGFVVSKDSIKEVFSRDKLKELHEKGHELPDYIINDLKSEPVNNANLKFKTGEYTFGNSKYKTYEYGDYKIVKFADKYYIVKGDEKLNVQIGNSSPYTFTLSEAKKYVADAINKKPLDEIATTQGFMGTTENLKQGTETPKKRLEIVKDLANTLGIPIRVGNYKAAAAGIYKVKPEVIRTAKAEDMPTIAHEVGHHLDKLYNLAEDIKANKLLKDEILEHGKEQAKLQKLGEDGQIKEGIAEFIRKYLTGEDVSGEFAKYITSKLDDGIKEGLEQFKNEYIKYKNADPVERVKSAISVGEHDKKSFSLSNLYTQFFDELNPIKKFTQKITNGEKLDYKDDPYIQARLAKGSQGKAESYIKHGFIDEQGNKIAPSLEEALKPVKKNIDNFRAYITAKRVIEKAEQDINTGITLEDAKVTVERLKSPEFEKAHNMLKQYQDGLLNMLKKSGILNDEQIKAMKANNAEYIPFYRVLEKEQNKFVKKGFANLPNPIKKMQGSSRTIIDPIESIIKNTYYFTQLADKNNVSKTLVNLAEKYDGIGKYIERIGDEKLPDGVKMLESAIKGDKENVISVFKNGERVKYQLHPDLYRAVMSLDEEGTNTLMKLLSAPAKALRAGAVLSPEFIARNPIRDAFSAAIYSKYGFIPGFDTAKGLFHVLKQDKLYQLWQQSGAANANLVSLDRKYMQENLRAIMNRGEIKRTVMDFVKNPLKPLQALSEVMEEATRLGEFAKGIKKEGMTDEGIQRAAFAARDITLDFAKMGTSSKHVNKVVAFFSASLNGFDKMIRAFKENPVGTTIKATTYITLPSIALWAMNHDKKEYQELPQWRKDLCWNIIADGKVYSIPKPFELGLIFGSLPERILDYVYEKDPFAMKEWANSFLENISPSVIPTSLLPVIEALSNYSFFRNQPIVPLSEQKLPAYMQYGDNTTGIAKVIGKLPKLINPDSEGISPRKVENIISGYTGGLGTDIMRGIDAIKNPENRHMSQQVLTRAFVSEPYQNSSSINHFYDLYKKYEKLYNAKKEAIKQGLEKAPETLSPDDPYYKYKDLENAADALKQMRKLEKEIKASNLKPEEKRKALLKLRSDMAEVARQAVKNNLK